MIDSSQSHLYFLAAGGTGGHVFPAIAVAQELLKHGQRPVLLADSRVAHYEFPAGVEVVILPTRSLAGGLTPKLQGLWALMKACFQAWRLAGKYRPRAVIGFGGYPAFPGAVAAILRHIPLILHEQNRVFGKVNRFLAPYAQDIALSFPDTRRVDIRYIGKTYVTGNPAREEILALYHQPVRAIAETGKLSLLVTGGSLGAKLFSEVIPAAISLLPPEMKRRLCITQQCHEAEHPTVSAHYAAEGVEAHLAPFFTDMASRLYAADLVICRAGASTVAEMLLAGKPAIYIPLAIAADDHQTANAQYVEAENAGWLLPQSQFEPEALAARLRYCLESSEVLAHVAEKAKQLAIVNAAERVAGLLS